MAKEEKQIKGGEDFYIKSQMGIQVKNPMRTFDPPPEPKEVHHYYHREEPRRSGYGFVIAAVIYVILTMLL